ncbi:MAG: hypothetical protein AAFR87_08460 [Bacteroidota bacterium]
MSQASKCPPVLFLVFNRPDVSALVFEEIRKAKPPRLYVAADGARPHKAGEAEKAAEVRKLATTVDWECEVKTLFREENLGCKMAVSGAIDWFFESEESGVILEDDCVPDQSFFQFCHEMLEYYKDDDRVMKISGSNFIGDNFTQQEYSYFFSRYTHVWGWATWRRAWKHFTLEMTEYEIVKENGLLSASFAVEGEEKHYWKAWEMTRSGKLDSWAYRWQYALRANSGLTVIPRINMVSNVGFGVDSTHTSAKGDPLENFPRNAMRFPLNHPKLMLWDKQADKFFYEKFLILSFSTRFKLALQEVIPPETYAKIKKLFGR